MRNRRPASAPCRRVEPTLRKNARPTVSLATNRMSSSLLVRNRPRFQSSFEPSSNYLVPAQTAFKRMRDNLFKVRIADEEVCQAAWRERVGTGQFGRCRRPVGLGIAGIDGQVRENFVGEARRLDSSD